MIKPNTLKEILNECVEDLLSSHYEQTLEFCIFDKDGVQIVIKVTTDDDEKLDGIYETYEESDEGEE